jgi:hypothetical protein
MNPVTLSDEERWFVALFASVQMLRTKKFRDQLQGFLVQNPEEQEKLAKAVRIKVDDVRDLANNAQARQILRNAHRYAVKLFQMDWAGLTSQKPANPFWTSDNPVVPYDNLYKSELTGGAFLDTPGIQVFFPISPRFLLMMLMSGHYRSTPVRPVRDKKEVWKANNSQFANSDRFIFASRDPEALLKLLAPSGKDIQSG